MRPCRLQGRIYRHPLRLCADERKRGADAGEIPAATEIRRGIAKAHRGRFAFLKIIRKTRKRFKIAVIKLLRLLAARTQTFAERIDPHTVDNPEVNDFGATPHFVRYVLLRDAEYLRSDRRMHIQPRFKDRGEFFVSRKECREPKLNLRVVKGNEHPPFGRYESAADTSAPLTFNGNVLKIRVL